MKNFNYYEEVLRELPVIQDPEDFIRKRIAFNNSLGSLLGEEAYLGIGKTTLLSIHAISCLLKGEIVVWCNDTRGLNLLHIDRFKGKYDPKNLDCFHADSTGFIINQQWFDERKNKIINVVADLSKKTMAANTKDFIRICDSHKNVNMFWFDYTIGDFSELKENSNTSCTISCEQCSEVLDTVKDVSPRDGLLTCWKCGWRRSKNVKER